MIRDRDLAPLPFPFLSTEELERLARFKLVYDVSCRLDLSLHDASRLSFAKWLCWRKGGGR